MKKIRWLKPKFTVVNLYYTTYGPETGIKDSLKQVELFDQLSPEHFQGVAQRSHRIGAILRSSIDRGPHQ